VLVVDVAFTALAAEVVTWAVVVTPAALVVVTGTVSATSVELEATLAAPLEEAPVAAATEELAVRQEVLVPAKMVKGADAPMFPSESRMTAVQEVPDGKLTVHVS